MRSFNSCFAVLLVLVLNSVTSTPINEQIVAQGLLGAHFGRIGIPATFDYIVVGGGTAGITLARRLAANTTVTVALVEAGGFYEFDAGNTSSIPADAVFNLGSDPIFRNPLIDWEQETTPQVGLDNRTAVFASGKTFGGGSARNFMFYQRASTGSYGKWADLVNDSSYEFNNFLPFMQKSVHFTPPNTTIRAANATTIFDADVFDSTGGPLQVSYPNWANPASSWLVSAVKEIGLTALKGFLSGDLLGYSYITTTIDPKSETRSSSETSFLREAILNTNNLITYKSTLAQKIQFTGKTATGVQVNSGGSIYQLNATKEVIISAGAFRSPQLLMTSGVGPQATLQEYGIPVVKDLPGVGQNLWDHLLFGPSYVVNVLTHSTLSNPSIGAQADAEYIENQTGPLTNPGADFIGFEKLPNGSISASTRKDLDESFTSDWPDVEYLFLDAFSGTEADLAFGGPDDGKNYVSGLVGMVAPFSRGNVTIASNDTAVNPIVNPNWLSDPRDQEVAVEGFKRVRKVFATKAMQGVVLGAEAFPGPNVTSDAEILGVIKKIATTIYHAAGTNAMGSSTDPMAVLDSKCRVFGVDGLRVVDASAFPLLPPGHPMATVYALAEKVANDILNGD